MSARAARHSSHQRHPSSSAAEFLRARDFLLANRSNYAKAYQEFQWPALERFNWAFDYFDIMAANNSEPALIIDTEDRPHQSFSFASMSERSNQVANFFRRLGIRRGERILVMLGNEVPLWESMLAACKLGAVIMPTSSAISTDDLSDRLERGQARYVIAGVNCKEKFRSCAGMYTRILVGGAAEGWVEYEQAYAEAKQLTPEVRQKARIPFCCISHRARQLSRNWSCIRNTATRLATSRRCIGSASNQETCTGTLVLQAGQSTLGVHCSLHGTQGHAFLQPTIRGSALPRRSKD